MASFHQHYLTFKLPTYHHPEHRFRSWSTQITPPSHLHTSMSSARNTHNHTYIMFCLKKINHLTPNPDKTICTLLTPDPPEYKQSEPQNKQHGNTHCNSPKDSGLYLRPKTHNISIQAHKLLQMIKALTATGWGKQKETFMATYKAGIRPALEYASFMRSALASSTSINKLQVMQNATLRTATGYTQNRNIHLHEETHILLIHEHLQFHASQYKQKIQHSSHPLHKHTPYFNTPRLKLDL